MITACGYGIDLESLVGKTDAEAVKEAELAGLIPASPMPPGIIPLNRSSIWNSNSVVLTPIRVVANWDNTHPIPLNDGGTFPEHPYLVIYALSGKVRFCEVSMGSPPHP